jgi:hypothetical protein
MNNNPCNSNANLQNIQMRVRSNFFLPKSVTRKMSQADICDVYSRCQDATSLPPMKFQQSLGKLYLIDSDSKLTGREYRILLGNSKISQLKTIAKKLNVILSKETKLTKASLKQKIVETLRSKGIREPILIPAKCRPKVKKNASKNKNNLNININNNGIPNNINFNINNPNNRNNNGLRNNTPIPMNVNGNGLRNNNGKPMNATPFGAVPNNNNNRATVARPNNNATPRPNSNQGGSSGKGILGKLFGNKNSAPKPTALNSQASAILAGTQKRKFNNNTAAINIKRKKARESNYTSLKNNVQQIRNYVGSNF